MSREKSKHKPIMVKTLDCKVTREEYRLDHPQQRESQQHDKETRDNIIACGLHDDPLPAVIICEQNFDGYTIYWVVDGKQRVLHFIMFHCNKIKLGNKIDRPIVKYMTTEVIDGKRVAVEKEFDIRGKFYKELPKELQERFDNYNVSADMYLDCTSDDIEYHIKRYNRSKPMNVNQKGVVTLGEDIATKVKELTAHDFFADQIGKYTANDLKNGSVERVVTDTIMATYFRNHWAKGNNTICSYIRDHASDKIFDRFRDMLDRLAEIVNEENNQYFTKKDSMIFMTLFNSFMKLGLDDELFAGFLTYFTEECYEEEFEETTYQQMLDEKKSNKDRSVMEQKLRMLNHFMMKYIEENVDDEIDGSVEEEIADRNVEKFVEAFASSKLMEEIHIGTKEAEKLAIEYLEHDFVLDEDETVNDYPVTDDLCEDVQADLDTVNEWRESLNDDFVRNNIVKLIKVARYAYEHDSEDETLEMLMNGGLPDVTEGEVK